MNPPPETAIIAITKHGVAQARELAAKLDGATLIVPEKFADAAGKGATVYSGPLRPQVEAWFARYQNIVFHVSLGAVVRLIASHLKSKDEDPAVLVVDDAGQFVISVLSGHVGGANAFCEQVAHALGATPVITTASDVGKTIPVDILGRELGWQVEPETKAYITAVSAAVVNEEPVALVQETGETNWWTRDTPLPKSITVYGDLNDVPLADVSAVLWVTDRIPDPVLSKKLAGRVVIYRPRSLVLGLGCDKGASRETLAEAVDKALKDHGLSPLSIRNIATIDKKRDEAGINELARELGVEVVTYPAAELAAVPDIPNPSEVVMKYMGTPAVGEPAAMLSAGASGLVIEKLKFKGADGLNATVSAARVAF
ncbi:MAG: cobalamin biosynthesis protein [Nitrospirota bacterium]|nr:cobalamin biosynthesis protein [Nitrospirota bacterium]